jgi:hypothetical protein
MPETRQAKKIPVNARALFRPSILPISPLAKY